MPDIQLRFHRDMLVLSAPVDAMLAKQGVSASRDRQYLNLMEPDSIVDTLRLEVMAGAQCLVTTTEDITRARLSHLRMDADADQLAKAAIELANEVKPQHILVEIGPCGLPLDPFSKASLNENRAQYADAARAFADTDFDAFFLNGFSSIEDLKCALMGVAQVGDKPVFAAVSLGTEPRETVEPDQYPSKQTDFSVDDINPDLPFGGYSLQDEITAPPVPAAYRACFDPSRWIEAIDVMADLGASVVGFETSDPIETAVAYAQAAAERTSLPILTELRVTRDSVRNAAKNLAPLDSIRDYTPDTLPTAAVKLYGAGVQFLRATGYATPACTGALAAAVMGLDVLVAEK